MVAASSQINDTMTALEVARAYHARAWRVLPVPYRSKRPVIEGWQLLRLATDELAEHFGNAPTNIGVLLGEPSGGLSDVDLDAPEAVSVGRALLPFTPSLFGRASKPRSHYLYLCDPDPKTERYKDFDGTPLVELRSTGAQTVYPLSVHPSGETVRWHQDGEPARIDGRLLRGYGRRVAAAALFARHWPSVGSRHDASLALAGGLLRAGWFEDDTVTFVVAVAEAAVDDEATARGDNVRTSAKRVVTGEPATGWRTLAELTGAKIVDKARDWLELRTELSVISGASEIKGGFGLDES